MNLLENLDSKSSSRALWVLNDSKARKNVDSGVKIQGKKLFMMKKQTNREKIKWS